MFASIRHALWKGTKAVATGNAQAQMGLQAPELPTALTRIGRAFYLTLSMWILGVWYSGYVNERTIPGTGPRLVLPGWKKVGPPDRSDPAAKWAAAKTAMNFGQDASTGAATVFPGGSGNAGGFLPKNAKYIPGRKDQGRDGQTDPGGPIIAPGAGSVLHILSDPGGFGPHYPVVKFTSGPYSSRIIYIGHTITPLSEGQRFVPGQVLSYTGKGPGGIGNATTPGWFEIGFADSGYPGSFGQPTPF